MRKGVTETGKTKTVKVAPNGHDQHAEATDAEGKVAGLTAFVVAFREDPEAFAEFLPIIGRDWDIMGDVLNVVPTIDEVGMDCTAEIMAGIMDPSTD